MSSAHTRFHIPKWPFYGAFLFFLGIILFWGLLVERMDTLALIGIFMCIGFSAILLIAPFWIEMQATRLRSFDDAAVAGGVREALEKAQTLGREIERLQQDTSKGVLIARQIPDRMDEKLKIVRDLLDVRSADEQEALRKELDILRRSHFAALENLSPDLERIVALLQQIEATAEKPQPLAAVAVPPQDSSASAASQDEDARLMQMEEQRAREEARWAKLQQALSWIRDRIDALREEFLKQNALPPPALPAATGSPVVRVVESSSSPQLDDFLDDLRRLFQTEGDQLRAQAASLQRIRETLSSQIADLQNSQKVLAEGQRQASQELRQRLDDLAAQLRTDIRTLAAQVANLQAAKNRANPKNQPETHPEFGFEETPEGEETDTPKTHDSQTIADSTLHLSITALVGVNNRIFLRGDEPVLSWDQGTPLEQTGINRWKWTADGVRSPISAKLLLNDDIWAEGDDLLLQPGQKIEIAPVFTNIPA